MKDILVSLLGAYTVTFLGIVVLALLLLMLQISESTVDLGIVAIYIIACFLAGMIAGKRIKSKKFIWGMLSGGIYFLLLMFISLVSQSSLKNSGSDLVTTFFICVGSGTLGGMLS